MYGRARVGLVLVLSSLACGSEPSDNGSMMPDDDTGSTSAGGGSSSDTGGSTDGGATSDDGGSTSTDGGTSSTSVGSTGVGSTGGTSDGSDALDCDGLNFSACGGDLLGSWHLRQTCEPGPTLTPVFPEVPACSDSYTTTRPRFTRFDLEVEADTFEADITIETATELMFTAACVDALTAGAITIGAYCDQIETDYSASAQDVSCEASDEACECAFTVADDDTVSGEHEPDTALLNLTGGLLISGTLNYCAEDEQPLIEAPAFGAYLLLERIR